MQKEGKDLVKSLKMPDYVLVTNVEIIQVSDNLVNQPMLIAPKLFVRSSMQVYLVMIVVVLFS